MAPTGSATGGLGGAVRRFSTLVVLSVVVCAGAAAALSFQSDPSYSGEATYLVPPGVGAASPESLTPFDAERIARTYSVVLSQDEQLLEPLASTVGRSRKDLADRTTAVALPNSSAVRVTYRGSDRGEVRRYFEELTSLVQTSSPATPNIRPGSLRLLKVSDDIPKSGGGSWVATVAGALAGLLLGLGAASWLSRALPKVRSASDLREAGGPSVLDVEPAQHHSMAALAVRLLEGLPEGAWIAVVDAADDTRADVEGLAGSLRSSVQALVAEESLTEAALSTEWLPAPFGGGGERIAQDSDRTLLVVGQGADLHQVASRLSDLRDLGVPDVVMGVVHTGARGKARSRVASEPATVLGPAGTPSADAG